MWVIKVIKIISDHGWVLFQWIRMYMNQILDFPGILHITLHFPICVQLFIAHSSQSLPNMAVILNNAKQSASAPWDLLGGQPNKCLCKFINENDVGILNSEKSNFFLKVNLWELDISFNFFGLHFGYDNVILLEGVVSLSFFETLDIGKSLIDSLDSWCCPFLWQGFTLQEDMALTLLLFKFNFILVHMPSFISVSNSPALAKSETVLISLSTLIFCSLFFKISFIPKYLCSQLFSCFLHLCF